MSQPAAEGRLLGILAVPAEATAFACAAARRTEVRVNEPRHAVSSVSLRESIDIVATKAMPLKPMRQAASTSSLEGVLESAIPLSGAPLATRPPLSWRSRSGLQLGKDEPALQGYGLGFRISEKVEPGSLNPNS